MLMLLSAMVEHRWLDRMVLGVAWDGTGYGPDGVIWGGEFLLAQAGSFRRIAHLRPFRLPGGEAAILQPWRCCLAVLDDAIGPEAAERFLPAAVSVPQRNLLRQIVAQSGAFAGNHQCRTIIRCRRRSLSGIGPSGV